VLYARGAPSSLAHDVVVLPFNDPIAVRRILGQHHERIAAVLLDPLPSRAGMVPATSDLRDVLQECCRKYGILLALDEVTSYRLDFRGAHAALGFEPDLVALAKIIGGGLPIGAVAGPARLMAVFDHTKGKPAVSHGGTFSANPLSMVAGAAALRAYDRLAVTRLNELGDRLRAALSEGLSSAGASAQVTGLGSLFRLHLKRSAIRDYRSTVPSPEQSKAIAEIQMALFERGYLLTPNCSGALSTPMTDTDIDDLAAAIIEATNEVHHRSPWSR
jgi:glutamate-1-semialdehyde 2,1-aminomutase